MKNAKSTKRALLMSVLSMMLCLAMLVGSTFAWFTDSVTSGMNRIVAGNLDVELYHTNGYVKTEEKVDASTKLFVSKDDAEFKWEPGAMLYENFTVKNAGTLALKYKLTLIAECNKTEDGKSLEDVLKVAVLDKAFDGDRDAAQELTFDKTVYDFAKTGTLAANAENTYAVVIWWEPSENDNDYNFNNGSEESLYIDLGVTLIAMQAAAEEDGFGSDYDANANGEPDHPDWGTITTNKTTVPVNPDGDTKIVGENISVSVPQDAIADDSLTLTFVQTDTPDGIVIASGKTTQAYDIKLQGLKADNAELITVSMFVGKDLTGVELYHNSDKIDFDYDPTTGIINFETTSFSPFTVVFDKALTVFYVTPENIQEYLNGEHGSMTDAKLILAPGEYGMLKIGVPSKYAGGDTVYVCKDGNGHSKTEVTFTDASEFLNHYDGGWHGTPYYTRTIDNLTLVGQEGVTVAGVLISSGHVYGNANNTVYDPVRDVYRDQSAYYMTHKLSNITFQDISFTQKVDINTSNADTVIDGVTFNGCSFTTSGTASTNGAGLRYYNESNNGNVRNLIVKDCTFKSCFQGIYTSNINGITVSQCTFDTTGHNAIAIQSGAHGAVNHKEVVIENNTFANIGDRIIRFGDIDAGTQLFIRNNVATNSGDDKGQVIKAQSFAEGVGFAIYENNWGENTTVGNEEFEDYTIDEGDIEDPFA